MTASAPEPKAPPAGLVRQLGLMLRALYVSRVGKVLLWLIVGLLAVVGLTAYGQIRLNIWNKPFYDALSRRDLRDFMVQLGVFFIIASGLLVLNVAQRWLVETLKLRLREGLVEDLVDHWMMPRRAYWLARTSPMGINPDQRLHEDARKLCELSGDLGVGLLQATILFISFAGLLWVLSAGFTIHLGGNDYPIPGFMLWAAILYAAAGSLLSYWVGGSLISRNAERYAREADLRFALVRVNEHLGQISLAEGEADEKRRVELQLGAVLGATVRLVMGLTNLTWVTAGFGWITLVAPILVAAPLYFSGKISFGGLMMAAAAFTQAQSSLRWFVDNFSVIADWRATLLRVAGFRQAVITTEDQDLSKHIRYAEGLPGVLSLVDLEVESPSGRDRLEERQVEVRAGERVLILSAPGTAKTLLFDALAGLWPWGAGRIADPKGEKLLYMPRGTPYLPSGSLREVLAYPLKVEDHAETGYTRVLDRLGLERLLPLLDESRRWDRDLSQDEQLSLAFARITLHAPAWLLIDDNFSALDEEALRRVIDVFTHELARTSVIHIGRVAPAGEALFPRVLHLVKAGGEPVAASGADAEPARRRPAQGAS